MPAAVYALTVGAFGIGTTEFVIMGLLLQVAADFQVNVASAGLLVSGYALGVFLGAPVLTLLSARWPRKRVLLTLMAIFIVGNVACALAPNYALLMVARVITSLTHGTFFGVGSVVATGLVREDRKASAISVMFTGLTFATLVGVPAGAWLGLQLGWRSTFWAVSALGLLGLLAVAVLVPDQEAEHVESGGGSGLREVFSEQVLTALLMTVLSWAGVFAVFTYVQPMLTKLAGFSDEAVSGILLLFGAGMIAGNLLGGKLADRKLGVALLGSLVSLATVLGLMGLAMHQKATAVVFVGLLGAAAFGTVAPLQLSVLKHAGKAGQTLASSLNIGAFNLGNAIGAWAGGWVIASGPGLPEIPWVAALIATGAVGVAVWSIRRERRRQLAKALYLFPEDPCGSADRCDPAEAP
ncbi:MFS transporter [Haloferula sp. BvORR071]|uniref:MFS transporter n=1 Tax=Haloferula sp. BvORR071 TaxID=1396141 RepID=UPI0009461B1F|nr:MFS transporter [Haloferula sp. BvORR071]